MRASFVIIVYFDLWHLTFCSKGIMRFHVCLFFFLRVWYIPAVLVVYPIVYNVFSIPGGAGFLPSTVSIRMCVKWSWTTTRTPTFAKTSWMKTWHLLKHPESFFLVCFIRTLFVLDLLLLSGCIFLYLSEMCLGKHWICSFSQNGSCNWKVTMKVVPWTPLEG